MRKLRNLPAFSILMSMMLSALIGCRPENNTLIVSTYGGKFVTGSTSPMTAPIIGGKVNGTFQGWDNSNSNILRVGTVSSFSGMTLDPDPVSGEKGAFTVANVEMPAYWNVNWLNNPTFCVDQTDIVHVHPVPWTGTYDLYPSGTAVDVAIPFLCYTNDPSHPNFDPTHVSPQVVLDDDLPTSIWFSALDQIPTGGTVNLLAYDHSLNDAASMTATTVAGNGSGATFPFPVGPNSTPLIPGIYIATLTNLDSSGTETVHGMEPFYIAHEDTSFLGAYGVTAVSPTILTQTTQGQQQSNGSCTRGSVSTSTQGGTPVPLVTLLTQGLLAVGNAGTTKIVGTNPTVVLGFNDHVVTTTTKVGACGSVVKHYSGAQSALVVNTGSNNISIVEVGSYAYPTGTVTVGNQPVAAVINPDETFAYISNYADGTISEVNLSTLTVSRTLTVMSHPASLAMDSSGNLWVGGQGSVALVNLSSWAITQSSLIDGTVNGMSYDANGSVLLQNILQNGSVTSPSNGSTLSAQISYSNSANQSYSTLSTFNTGSSTATTAQPLGDNASYSQSSISTHLAFPAQTAFAPPVYSSSNGDVTASVSGTVFTVSIVGTGQIVIQGTLPHPARGVAITSSMIYFTVPDSNSLISLPVQLP